MDGRMFPKYYVVLCVVYLSMVIGILPFRQQDTSINKNYILSCFHYVQITLIRGVLIILSHVSRTCTLRLDIPRQYTQAHICVQCHLFETISIYFSDYPLSRSDTHTSQVTSYRDLHPTYTFTLIPTYSITYT